MALGRRDRRLESAEAELSALEKKTCLQEVQATVRLVKCGCRQIEKGEQCVIQYFRTKRFDSRWEGYLDVLR